MSKTAVILAGGLGKRLLPWTKEVPKVLLPIQNTPLLGIILGQLSSYGFERVILAIRHLGELIRFYCGDGSKWNLSIEYSEEAESLGTIGPLKLIETLPENFLIMNGDILTDIDFEKFYHFHLEGKKILTLSSYQYEKEFPYGVLEIEAETLKSYIEKPLQKQLVNMGIYMAHRTLLPFVPPNRFYGLNHLLEEMVQRKKPIGVYQHQGTWVDVGDPQSYVEAQEASR